MVLSAFVSGAMANAGAREGYRYQADLQAQAALLNYIYARKSALNSPSWNREGLQNAGYNPMLAVQNSTSGANSSWTSPGNAPTPDYSGVVSNYLDAQRVQNETEQTESNVALQGEQAQTEQSKRRNLEFQNAMYDVETHLKQEDLDHYDRRFYTEMYEMMQRAEKMRQEASVVGYNAESQRILANASKQQAENESVSNPIKYAHDTVKRHLKSFEKDHPSLSKTSQFKSLTNYVRYND